MEREKCHVMVIDDEPIVGKRLKQILEKAGYRIEVFVDGYSALNDLKKSSYDIIVTDMNVSSRQGGE